jgi:hypothetical protein
MIVGMTDKDTRRHYYDLSLGYPIRYCTWTYEDADFKHLVPMEGVKPDCKNCLKKAGLLPTGGK